jgi:hypothetical protein
VELSTNPEVEAGREFGARSPVTVGDRSVIVLSRRR